MLFNSIEFIFWFLPITLIVFYYLGSRYSHSYVTAWLVLSSLFFYGWWNPSYLIIIVFSMIFNYALGAILGNGDKSGLRRYILWFGILVNLASLGYFKYFNFFIEQINVFTEFRFNFEYVVLPLAISFFTFQQIAFLVDSYRGETTEYNFLQYCLFVTFFPQLIAGPIVHHKEMLPQFLLSDNFKINIKNITIGLSIFSIGLFKKTVIADGISPYANIVFDIAATNDPLTFFLAWGGALAYTFQLYFDFSGYSDMAIGLARLFGIILPLNFYSPYKALNITEFWRRWHITLSTFLKDYLYIALGGNRDGLFYRYRNLFLTMFLGGLWHGAGWNFAIWGALHGFYLIINHSWIKVISFFSIPIPKIIKQFLAWSVTFVAVVVGWVFFRATSLDAAISILSGMSGINGISIPNAMMARLGGLQDLLLNIGVSTHFGSGGALNFVSTWLWIIILFPIVLVFPNTQDLFNKYQGSLSDKSYNSRATFWPFFSKIKNIYWKENMIWAVFISTMLVTGMLTLSQVSEFLYFQF
jgi:alginate O-acetyltransferase complex protein AlgI